MRVFSHQQISNAGIDGHLGDFTAGLSVSLEAHHLQSTVHERRRFTFRPSPLGGSEFNGVTPRWLWVQIFI